MQSFSRYSRIQGHLANQATNELVCAECGSEIRLRLVDQLSVLECSLSPAHQGLRDRSEVDVERLKKSVLRQLGNTEILNEIEKQLPELKLYRKSMSRRLFGDQDA